MEGTNLELPKTPPFTEFGPVVCEIQGFEVTVFQPTNKIGCWAGQVLGQVAVRAVSFGTNGVFWGQRGAKFAVIMLGSCHCVEEGRLEGPSCLSLRRLHYPESPQPHAQFNESKCLR